MDKLETRTNLSQMNSSFYIDFVVSCFEHSV